jgi:hypothetical protein
VVFQNFTHLGEMSLAVRSIHRASFVTYDCTTQSFVHPLVPPFPGCRIMPDVLGSHTVSPRFSPCYAIRPFQLSPISVFSFVSATQVTVGLITLSYYYFQFCAQIFIRSYSTGLKNAHVKRQCCSCAWTPRH